MDVTWLQTTAIGVLVAIVVGTLEMAHGSAGGEDLGIRSWKGFAGVGCACVRSAVGGPVQVFFHRFTINSTLIFSGLHQFQSHKSWQLLFHHFGRVGRARHFFISDFLPFYAAAELGL